MRVPKERTVVRLEEISRDCRSQELKHCYPETAAETLFDSPLLI
jgi:hypothetical protein